jgi:hypothetical protein
MLHTVTYPQGYPMRNWERRRNFKRTELRNTIARATLALRATHRRYEDEPMDYDTAEIVRQELQYLKGYAVGLLTACSETDGICEQYIRLIDALKERMP